MWAHQSKLKKLFERRQLNRDQMLFNIFGIASLPRLVKLIGFVELGMAELLYTEKLSKSQKVVKEIGFDS